jgi:hypothetical protein
LRRKIHDRASVAGISAELEAAGRTGPNDITSNLLLRPNRMMDRLMGFGCTQLTIFNSSAFARVLETNPTPQEETQ